MRESHVRLAILCDFAARGDTSRGFNSEWYQKWYESGNHAGSSRAA
jgi:hypothetical protein